MFGRCPDCGAWNSLQEVKLPPKTRLGLAAEPIAPTVQTQTAITLAEVNHYAQPRLPSGYSELDRVLGGGLVPGSLVLIGGEPGIGKSTLLLAVADKLAQSQTVLYVCAEESVQQVKMRAQRLGISPATTTPLYLLSEIDLDIILGQLQILQPAVVVIDSIQSLYLNSLSSAPGSVSQVRECTAILMRFAKKENITLLIVGHVTKEGTLAGPKVLEHLVDTVLYFEGDRFASHRLLRSVKNRFGATQEVGVFEMVDAGLREISNPSALFLGSREEPTPGTATIVSCEGTRPLVVELQALVSPTSYASPRRTATGIETNRFLQILAVLEKRLGIPLSKLDAYVAAAGGLHVSEPAVDLGVALAVAASFKDRILDPATVFIGEVGLGGQIRAVSQLEARLREAAKLGFQRAMIPKTNLGQDYGLTIVPVATVQEAIRSLPTIGKLI